MLVGGHKDCVGAGILADHFPNFFWAHALFLKIYLRGSPRQAATIAQFPATIAQFPATIAQFQNPYF